jgi:hypothetical protein
MPAKISCDGDSRCCCGIADDVFQEFWFFSWFSDGVRRGTCVPLRLYGFLSLCASLSLARSLPRGSAVRARPDASARGGEVGGGCGGALLVCCEKVGAVLFGKTGTSSSRTQNLTLFF